MRLEFWQQLKDKVEQFVNNKPLRRSYMHICILAQQP
jgi:hypothetical protein